MIKDIEYFLEKEEEFCKEHPDYGELCYDEEIEEMSEVGINDRNNFLSDRTISEYYSHIKNPLGNEDAYGIGFITVAHLTELDRLDRQENKISLEYRSYAFLYL